MQGTSLNNQALQLDREGDLEGALRLHLQALDVKERGYGPDHTATAITRNALGELYMRMGKLDEAEENLKIAIRIRDNRRAAFDAAVSRENLAQLYEMKGNLREAKDIRLSGGNQLCCSNYTCTGQLFPLPKLSQCAGCKSAFYCSKACQVKDWKLRHKRYCKAQ
ncbi:hypothetical protein JAAARDRAFT_75870 [Jaapia argillacea MUCL 33604]|uniref:MYND-type domain-containing protein n=1 Tax=Jaapia argillacea MUCL 33604 TaxID=933084 RepID=A0A067Q910_9AGAM|nr:hypothetical protein JAAARDRAFT_75870 [Jaapia argillacea MUCL 33604]